MAVITVLSAYLDISNLLIFGTPRNRLHTRTTGNSATGVDFPGIFCWGGHR